MNQLKKQVKIKQKFPYNKIQTLFHIIFVTLNVLYFLYRIPIIAINNKQQYKSCQSFISFYIRFTRYCGDHQWQSFRNNLLPMIMLIIAWNITVRIISLNKRSTILGLSLCLFSFRGDSIFYFLFLTLWYQFTKKFYKKKWIISSVWFLTIIILLINQKTNHLRPISTILDTYIPDSLSFIKSKNAPIHWANILNMSLLKLISFTVDNHRQQQQRQLQKHKQKCKQCKHSNNVNELLCQRGRDYFVKPALTYYNFLNYMLFAPTFLAGPPISYKNYHSFSSIPTQNKPYYIRMLILLASFELYQHFYPVIHLLQNQSLVDMQILSLFTLVFIWYKFLIIWKLGRLWALMCGVDVVDNMNRCLFNNYNFVGFWRMWHRGFNHWLIRYLFIPLGGNKNYLSYICVITFVAFWHDHSINIVLWAFVIFLFIIPQIIIKAYFQKNYNKLYNYYWFKYLSAFMCAIYIYLLILTNLIGFGYGYQKAGVFLQKLFQQWPSTVYSIITVTSAVCLMFYIRHSQGNVKNY